MPDTALLRRPTDAGTDPTSRWSAWVAILAVVAGLVVAPPWGGGGDIPEGFAARLAAGQLEREADDGWAAVEVGDLLARGTRVRSVDGARLDVEGGELSIAGGGRAVLDAVTALEAGSLLHVVPDDDRVVRLGAIIASGRGAWRVDAGAAPRVGVYEGGAGLRVAGDAEQVLAIGQYEQADLVGGGLPGEPLPLRYSPQDSWDARLLASVLAADRQAAQARATLAGRFGEEPLPESFYTDFQLVDGALLEALPRYGTVDEDRIGPPADVLLGVIVTDLVRRSAALSGEGAARRVTSLRADGATWGIVLALHGLGADDLRGATDLALRSGPVAAPPTVTPDEPTDAPTAPGEDPGTGPSPSEEPPDDQQPPSEPGPEPSPSDSPAPGPCQLEPCEPVNEGVDEVTDLLDELAPGTGDTIDDLVSEVPTILPPDDLGVDDVGGLLDPN